MCAGLTQQEPSQGVGHSRCGRRQHLPLQHDHLTWKEPNNVSPSVSAIMGAQQLRNKADQTHVLPSTPSMCDTTPGTSTPCSAVLTPHGTCKECMGLTAAVQLHTVCTTPAHKTAVVVHVRCAMGAARLREKPTDCVVSNARLQNQLLLVPSRLQGERPP